MALELLKANIERYIKISDADWAFIASQYSILDCKKKQLILQNGEKMSHEIFVLSGCLKTYLIDNKGVERILQFSPEGWWCGDFDSFNKSTYSTLNIQAIEPATLAVITQDKKEAMFERIPALERFFRILMQNAMISMQRRILSNMSETADERYAGFMQKFPGLDQRVSQQDIASYLGITPEFLSKTKKRFLREH